MSSDRGATRLIKESIRKSMEGIESLDIDRIKSISAKLIECLNNDGKIMLCGNGGSASQAQHIAAELVCKFRMNRRAYAAIALTTDTSIITAQANDHHFDSIFERQIEAHGRKGDVLIGLSTSGKSRNVAKAMQKAKESGIFTVALIGNDRKSSLVKIADEVLFIESSDTPRIQEAHLLAGHIICDLVEKGSA